MEYLQVITTVASREDARRIARTLVERRLAGCVQVVGPISSTYRWQGSIEEDEEWLCLIKTAEARYLEVEGALREVHPYETPEIIAHPIVAGGRDYLAWLRGALQLEDVKG
jgi:periplasmic divalent cation tolerance protein